jgi:hypothetical protein
MNTTTAHHAAPGATHPTAGEERRRFLLAALQHDAADDAVTELLFEHVVLGRYDWIVVANSLEPILGEVVAVATWSDWVAVAERVLDPEAHVTDPQASRRSETGTAFDVALIRGFLRAVAEEPLVAERLSCQPDLWSPAAGPDLRAAVLKEEVRGVLRSGTDEDWNMIAGQLIREARDVTGPAAKGAMD